MAWAERGEDVILVRRETNPDDLHGMIAAQGILTSRGGKTSHAAVVARGMGKTCVCGAEELEVDVRGKKFTAPGDITVSEGDVISIDGTSGQVYLGEVAVVASPVVEYFEGKIGPSSDELVEAVHRLMTHADAKRRLGVRANSDNGEDSARAVRFGAQGIGLCRTEHMFLGERRQLVERLILADDDATRTSALDALEPLQRGDFVEIFEAMDGLPMTIRLLDPPLHEFLPDLTELSVQGRAGRRQATAADHKLLEAVRRLHEQNPMLGLRGVRLGLVIPGLYRDAGPGDRATRPRTGSRPAGDPQPEIMIPLVGATSRSSKSVREEAEQGAGRGRRGDRRRTCTVLIGTMIEVPRAALTAGQIAEAAEFFSFGTNDLTQMAWGFSRDDVEALVLQPLPRDGHLRRLPVRDDRRGGRRPAGADRRRGGPGHQAGPEDRRLRRARRRPGLGALLPLRGPRLRVLLAVPGARRPAGGRPRRRAGDDRGQRQQVRP